MKRIRFPSLILAFALTVLVSQTNIAQEPKESATLDFRPIAYFNNQCARCHGPGGSFYGDEFAQDKSFDELHAVVKEMAAGPGGYPLTGDSLDALVAYHISLSRNIPFLTIDTYSDSVIAGEVAKATTVKIVSAKYDTIPVTPQKNRWRFTDSNSQFSSSTLVAKQDSQSQTLKIGENLYVPLLK